MDIAMSILVVLVAIMVWKPFKLVVKDSGALAQNEMSRLKLAQQQSILETLQELKEYETENKIKSATLEAQLKERGLKLAK